MPQRRKSTWFSKNNKIFVKEDKFEACYKYFKFWSSVEAESGISNLEVC